MKKEKVEFFSLAKGSYIMNKEEYDKCLLEARKILEELNFQCHLHGEVVPTPNELIAKECFLLGFILGEKCMGDKIIKELGIGEEVEKRINESRNKREDRKMMKVINGVIDKHNVGGKTLKHLFDLEVKI